MPVPRRRLLHRPHEPLDGARDDDGALVREAVLLPGLPEQLQHPRVSQARHGHRHPPRGLPFLPDQERRAPLGDRRRPRRVVVRRVVPRRGRREEAGAGAFLHLMLLLATLLRPHRSGSVGSLPVCLARVSLPRRPSGSARATATATRSLS